MSWLIAILGLAFLVLIHESGHFYTARALGMRPRRFYIGFPPAVFKVNRGGIEYGVGLYARVRPARLRRRAAERAHK